MKPTNTPKPPNTLTNLLTIILWLPLALLTVALMLLPCYLILALGVYLFGPDVLQPYDSP